MQYPERSYSHSVAPSVGPLSVALRQATARAHEAVERLPLMARLTSPAVTWRDYRHYLHQLAGLYARLEGGLLAELDESLRARLGVRPKLPALLQDLEQAGWNGPACVPRPTMNKIGPLALCATSKTVGGLYVLEGATLGGRVIARHLRRVLGSDLGGATFLGFHGDQAGSAWRHFTSALDALCAEGVLMRDETIAGARATFEYVYLWLGRTDRSQQDPAGAMLREASRMNG